MPTDQEITIQCQGCENECQVSVAFRNGEYLCLGGNNCPTGASFAIAQCRHQERFENDIQSVTPSGTNGSK